MSFSSFADLASVVGLIITLVGFVVTIASVWKARRAAEDAKEAAREVISRFGERLLEDDLDSAVQLISEIDAASREHNWSFAMVRCIDVRTRLVRLSNHPNLETIERDEMKVSMDESRLLLDELERLRRASSTKDLSAKRFHFLHDQIALMSRIQSRIEFKELEV